MAHNQHGGHNRHHGHGMMGLAALAMIPGYRLVLLGLVLIALCGG
jgi:hypothetical protein